MIRRFILFFFYCILLQAASAQSDSLQKQINEQVWKPFIKSFSEMNTDAFMAVHSRDMTRVSQDGKMIFSFEKYYEDNKRGDDRSKQAGRKRTIELRFTQRIAANGKAFEVGYYKTTSIQPDGQSRSFYGKFHVLLRKENNAWKILMDADASEKTDETVFLTGQPLE